MLTLKLISENTEKVIKGLEKKHFDGAREAIEKVLEFPEDLHAFTIFPIGYPVQKNAQQDRFNPEKIHYVR